MYEDIEPTIVIIKANHHTIRVKNIVVLVNYFHEQYSLLTIDTFKLKSTIQTEDIITKSSTGPLLKCHYSYIFFTRYYPPLTAIIATESP